MTATVEGQAAIRILNKAPSTEILRMSTNIINVAVDHVVVPTLIDTGASISVMSDEFRRRLLKILTPAGPQHLRTVNRQPLSSLGVCTARLLFRNTVVPVQFVVLNNSTYDIYNFGDGLFGLTRCTHRL